MGNYQLSYTGAQINTAIERAISLSENTGSATDVIMNQKGVTEALNIARTHTFSATSESAMLGLAANIGDLAFRTDESKTYILTEVDPTVLSNWKLILSPAGSSVITFTVNVTNNWVGDSDTGYTQDIEVSGLLATDSPFIDIVFSSDISVARSEAENYAKISKATTSNGTLMLSCFYFMPTIAFNLLLKCIR
ncbi:hypothetical protein FACS189465_0500 [Clostridia bacterium]|nr:hypothetical protein FACS189465_0500 [Clostridia bacterium]